MSKSKDVEEERVELVTLLGTLSDRLRIQAQALRGMAAENGDPQSLDGRIKSALAGEIGGVAKQIEWLRTRLCPSCRVTEVVASISVDAEEGHPGRRVL